MTLVDPRGLVLVKVIWAEFAIASLVVILRVYATFFLRATDNPYAKAATYCTLLAWILGLLSNVAAQLAVQNGAGLHLVDIPKAMQPAALLCGSIADFVSRLSIAAAKTAVVLFLCAIQHRAQKRWQQIVLGFVALTNICLSIALVFIIMFQCSPPQKLWHRELAGSCSLSKVNDDYSYSVVAWGAASDMFLTLYPTYLFWSLSMDRKTKIGVTILCGLGLVAAACAIVTSVQLHVLTELGDATYSKTPLTKWSFSEMWVVIIAASIPPAWPSIIGMSSHLAALKRNVLNTFRQSKPSAKTTSALSDLTEVASRPLESKSDEQWELRSQTGVPDEQRHLVVRDTDVASLSVHRA